MFTWVFRLPPRCKWNFNFSGMSRNVDIYFWHFADRASQCSKHVEVRNKTYCEKKFCASSWLNTEINVCVCLSVRAYVVTFEIFYEFSPHLAWNLCSLRLPKSRYFQFPIVANTNMADVRMCEVGVLESSDIDSLSKQLISREGFTRFSCGRSELAALLLANIIRIL